MSLTISRLTATAMAIGLAITSSSLRAQGQGGPPAPSGVVDVEGTLEVQVEDAVGGAKVHQFLDTAAGRIRLKEKPGKSELFGLETGSRIRVHGLKNGNPNELELAGGNTSSVTVMGLATSNTFGQQRVAVLMVNFQDNAAVPYNWSDEANVTFGQASDFYVSNSFNQASLTGDVFGYFTLPMSSAVCDSSTLASLADQAATNAGVNLNNYTRLVYSFPSNACAWWGLGTVGGNPSRAWINGTYSLKVVAHELGHNFGLYHSNSMPCASGTCTATEYGDDRDMMGGTATGEFHAYQKERLGWLNYGSSPAIQTVTGSGTYWIGNYEAGAAPAALKVLKSATATDQTYYYLEARAQAGYDAPYAPGVLVHSGNSSDGNTAYEIDLDPVTSGFDSLLDPGQTFADTAAGVTVTTVSADASGAWVSITYAGTPCATAAPTVTLSPGSQLTSPSVTASYSMKVKDNDNPACAPAAFGIGMSLPAGWAWSAAQPSISIAPGSTGGTTVYVTPPGTANGPTSVSALASRTGSGPSGSGAATITVATGLSVSLKTSGGSLYSITATVLAGASPLTGATVTFTIIDPKGGVTTMSGLANSSGVVTVKGRLKGKDPHGTYSVTASVSSGALTGTANGSFVY